MNPHPTLCVDLSRWERLFSSALLLLLLVTLPAHAAVEVPIVTYEQKVNIVVQAQKNPAILSLKIDQKDADVTIAAVVDKNTDRSQAVQIAQDVVLLVKSLSLDDKPTDEKTVGKGLYTYHVTINRVDNVLLLSAHKDAKEKEIKLDPPVELPKPTQIRPWTRADETSQSSGANP